MQLRPNPVGVTLLPRLKSEIIFQAGTHRTREEESPAPNDAGTPLPSHRTANRKDRFRRRLTRQPNIPSGCPCTSPGTRHLHRRAGNTLHSGSGAPLPTSLRTSPTSSARAPARASSQEASSECHNLHDTRPQSAESGLNARVPSAYEFS